mmetsp:Transcript_138328/g.336219  ORF Transcript_138328/g.336219 Transcript_138328/m.336219 type:complete len:205 (-) Transcript_138328:79-693(-)
MRAEVQADVVNVGLDLAERRLAVLGHDGHIVRQQLRRVLGLPREALGRLVLHHSRTAVSGDGLTVGPHPHEGRDAAHLVLAAQLVLLLVAKGDGLPRHLAEVAVKGTLVTVRRREHDLEVLRLVVRLVEVDEHRREHLARRAPVRAEVDAHVLALKIRSGDLGAASADHVADKSCRHLVGVKGKRFEIQQLPRCSPHRCTWRHG